MATVLEKQLLAGERDRLARLKKERPRSLSPVFDLGLDRDAVIEQPPGRQVHDVTAPPALVADAERRERLEHRDLTAALMGDPLPGQSALDLRRACGG